MSRDGYLPPGCTQKMCDEAQPGYWDEPKDDFCELVKVHDAALREIERLKTELKTMDQWVDDLRAALHTIASAREGHGAIAANIARMALNLKSRSQG